jgi:hypothetical protein
MRFAPVFTRACAALLIFGSGLFVINLPAQTNPAAT